MAEAGLRFFTVAEADELLPRLKPRLRALRELRGRIAARQALVDAEELSGGPRPDHERIAALLRLISADVQAFHEGLAAFRSLGCELKDLERGAVDFYTMRGNEVACLSWLDGEEAVRHWHPLDQGTRGRRPL